MPLGKVPSGLLCTFTNSTGTFFCLNTASILSTIGPAAPLPELITNLSGFNLLKSI